MYFQLITKLCSTQVATIISSLIITSLGETENFLQTKMNKMREQDLCREWYTELGIRQRWFMIGDFYKPLFFSLLAHSP